MKKDIFNMAYILFEQNIQINESGEAAMTAKELATAGITSIKGYGGIDINVNGNGFLVNPAQHLPSGLLDNLKNAWSSSDGDVSKFYSQTIDGKSVKDILSGCPSQQSFGIAKELGLPNGTHVPCQNFTDKNYSAVKYNSSSSSAGGSSSDGSSATNPSDGTPAVGDGGTGAGGDTSGGDPGAADPGTAEGNWWSFFGSKEFLIGAVAIAGVIAAIKALGNTIKARFRKCAKVLYNMQKDFGTKEDGMDMKSVLPGVGSKITDWITRLWGAKKGVGKNKGALGLRPFVDNYRYEIEGDLAESKKAFNLIRAAADSQTSGAMNNLEKPKQPNESVDESHKVYESFADAINDGILNESEQLNELALGTAIAAGSLALSAIKLAAGAFKFKSKDKDGNDIEKEVKVTPKSVREICYSILNVFYGKYFDLERVFDRLGVKDLGDIDRSNVDKFMQVVKQSSKELPTDGKSKMFARVERNYNEMVESYVKIGTNVVNNFEKFTKQRKGIDGKVKELSEKDSNLLVSATEKLRAELRRQEDGYKNNFARVMNAIIASKEYAEFTDFIIEKVMPVFKSGLASDADYVLDIVPKKGEYYIVRQTNAQSGLEQNDTAKGNVVLVKVVDFVQDGKGEDGKDLRSNPKITFERVAILTDPGSLTRTERMEYDMTGYDQKNMDKSAFASEVGQQGDGTTVNLLYNKWLALDPHLAINVPGENSEGQPKKSAEKVYARKVEVTDASTGEKKEQEQFIVILPNTNEARAYNEESHLNEEGENAEDKETQQENEPTPEETPQESEENPVVKNILFVAGDNKKLITIENNNTNLLDFDAFVKTSDEDKLKSMGFTEVPEEQAKTVIEKTEELKQGAQEAKVNTKEDIPAIINRKPEAGEEANSEIGADVILKNIDTISNNIAQGLSSIKAEDFEAKQVPGGTAYTYKNGKAQLVNTVDKQRAFNSIIPFETGATTKSGKKIYVAVQPRLVNNVISADIILVCGDGTAFDEIKFRGAQKDSYVTLQTPFTKESVDEGIKTIVNYYKANAGKYTIEESDITVEYDKYFNVAESYMSSFGMIGTNKLHVKRTIKAPKSKLTYYALSENAWGDGSKLDPEKYLTESLDNMLNKYKTFDEFAVAAKNSRSINLIKIAEDCSYDTALPYNRYQMLTASNPLYEGLVIVRFDSEGNLVESIRTGVKKIYCETV